MSVEVIWTCLCLILVGELDIRHHLEGRGSDGRIITMYIQEVTRQEESYRLWRVVVRDRETLWNEEAIARARLQSQRK
jgi:hypothetical protein